MGGSERGYPLNQQKGLMMQIDLETPIAIAAYNKFMEASGGIPAWNDLDEEQKTIWKQVGQAAVTAAIESGAIIP